VLLVFFFWKCGVDCGEARFLLPRVECDCRAYLLTALTIWDWFAEFVVGSLHSGVSVCVDNAIGPSGAKALGDALKDNSTLTSLSLYLGGQ
jgi:hypothetical protein